MVFGKYSLGEWVVVNSSPNIYIHAQEANYMMAEDDTAEYVELIAQDMAGRWRIKTPKLVLSIISSSQYYKPWNTPQDEEDFQDGLMLVRI